MKKTVLWLFLMTSHVMAEKLLVFVSLSMPSAALKSLYHDAHAQGGKLVVRGLYKNSFHAMQQKIKELRINVEVDPSMFETYSITHVPSFVLLTKDKAIKASGNVSLFHVLEVLKKP